MKVVGPLALLLLTPVLLLIAAFGGLPEAIETSAAPAAVAEIPPEHLAVMQQVSNQTGIPWQILAAISEIESGFGSNMGPSSAGALGYCQFMPGTWTAYGVDGDGDGIDDPYNYRDCTWPPRPSIASRSDPSVPHPLCVHPVCVHPVADARSTA